MPKDDKRLRTLFDYTIFHIGVYTSLITGLFAVIAWAQSHCNTPLARAMPIHLIKGTVFCFLIAGAAGGAIVSNIAEKETFEDLTRGPLKVFSLERLPFPRLKRFLHYDRISRLEHLAFWVGILLASIGFLIVMRRPPCACQ